MYSVVQLHRHQNMLLYHLGNGMYEPSHVTNMDETSMQQVLLTSKTLGKKDKRNVSGTGDCRRGVHHTHVIAVAMDGTELALLFIFKSKEGDEIPQIQVIQVGADAYHAILAIAKPALPLQAPVVFDLRRVSQRANQGLPSVAAYGDSRQPSGPHLRALCCTRLR